MTQGCRSAPASMGTHEAPEWMQDVPLKIQESRWSLTGKAYMAPWADDEGRE